MDERVTEAIRLVADRFRSPAELDVFVHTHRRPASSADELAIAAGLRVSHAQQVAEHLVASGAIVRSARGYEVAEELRADAVVVSAVFDHYRHRLVDAVVAADR